MDAGNSALASGAGTAFDCFAPFLLDSTPDPLIPPPRCLKTEYQLIRRNVANGQSNENKKCSTVQASVLNKYWLSATSGKSPFESTAAI